jgi:hypothetical protein
MKYTVLAAVILVSLTEPTSLLAEELSLSADPTATAAPAAEVSTAVDTGTPRPMYGKAMMQERTGHGAKCMMNEGTGHRGKCMKHEGTGQGSKCMMYGGKGKHSKGHERTSHGGGNRETEGHHGKHDQVVHRLEMIEARMSKIEAMLEILLQR